MNGQDISHLHHCVYSLRYHLVLVVKRRRKVLTGAMLGHIEATARTRIAAWSGRVVEMNGEADHVHYLVELPPNVAISDFVNALKTTSSRLLRRDFPALKGQFKEPVLWSRSYFVASCGGAPLEAVKAYIQAQDRPDEASARKRPSHQSLQIGRSL